MRKTEDLIGKTFDKVEQQEDELIFENKIERYTYKHLQECCEQVSISDIVGDLTDLIGSPITFAEEAISDRPIGFRPECDIAYGTWTFYKFATIKGYVDVRWFGESNGYYSEGVDLIYTDLTKH